MDALDRALLRFIHDFTATHGYPPSVREMSQAVNLELCAVHGRLRKSQCRGELNITPHTARTWRLTAAGEREAGAHE